MPAIESRAPATWALGLLAALLAGGFAMIFRARFESGRYPSYSSLASDPSGTALLFDALTKTGKFHAVTRGFEPFSEARYSGDAVMFLGYPARELEAASVSSLQDFENTAQRGNRVLLAIKPPLRLGKREHRDHPEAALKTRWKIQLGDSSKGQEGWPLYFDSAAGWTTALTINGRPVIIERAFGSGTIVLCLNSAMFTNSSIAEGSDDEIVAKLVGSEQSVVFDENHLGVADSGSILGLARRYRLTGLLWGFIVFALAFIWNQASGFPPVSNAPETTVAGRDAHSGLTQLLQGQIPPDRLIETCLAEWKRVHPKDNLDWSAEPDLVASFRMMQEQSAAKKSNFK